MTLLIPGRLQLHLHYAYGPHACSRRSGCLSKSGSFPDFTAFISPGRKRTLAPEERASKAMSHRSRLLGGQRRHLEHIPWTYNSASVPIVKGGKFQRSPYSDLVGTLMKFWVNPYLNSLHKVQRLVKKSSHAQGKTVLNIPYFSPRLGEKITQVHAVHHTGFKTGDSGDNHQNPTLHNIQPHTVCTSACCTWLGLVSTPSVWAPHMILKKPLDLVMVYIIFTHLESISPTM